MAQDFTADIEPVVRPVLAGDERLLAASPLVKDPGATEDVEVGDELKNLLDPTMLIGLGSHPGNLAQQAVFGRAVFGGPTGTGRAVFAAVEGAAAPTLAVTDARLLILDVAVVPRGQGLWQRWFGPVDRVASVAYDVPPGAVVGAVPAPAGALRRGRFLIAFADRSGCALVCALPKLRDRAVAAIGPPH